MNSGSKVILELARQGVYVNPCSLALVSQGTGSGNVNINFVQFSSLRQDFSSGDLVPST